MLLNDFMLQRPQHSISKWARGRNCFQSTFCRCRAKAKWYYQEDVIW